MSRKAEMLGIFIGAIAGGATYAWYQASKTVKDSSAVDTGQKTPDGKSIVQVTGVGGADSGKVIKGYELPSSIDDVKLPLKVVVRPNKDLFMEFKAGDEVTFTIKRGDELVWLKTTGDTAGDYSEWYSTLKDKVLGAV